MSWQEYVDSSLLSSGKITQAAILGHDGGLWATSTGLSLSETDIAAILSSYTHPEQMQSSGLTVAGTKFFLLRQDERSIYLRKAETGLIIVKTSQCVLVAFYDSNQASPGDATKTVEELADYLVGVGY